jgi:putative ABC transport system permease protein
MLNFAAVQSVSASTDIPGRSIRSSNGGVRIVGQETSKGNSFRVIMSDEDFMKTYGMTLLEGRTFSRTVNEAWKTCLVNETAMKLLGFADPKSIIGQRIYVWDNTLEIVGVVKDYHQESLRKKVDQIIFVCDKDVREFISISILPNESPTEVVASVEKKYAALFPGNPFTFFFADDYYNQQYQSEQQFMNVFGLFSALAITIACLGLFGLSSYMALRRTKEVSIRKVLGASVNQIALLVSKEFLLIVLIGNVIAFPIAYVVMDQWVSEFAYRIELGVITFLLPPCAHLLLH